MDEGASTSTVPPGVPDWNTIDREILCPLCDYNLRGLVEPRCPECGHLSRWAELLDVERWRHPWLFEHRGKNPIARLFRTFRNSLFPRRFWEQVKPTHLPHAGRLILYWFLVSLLFVLPLACMVATKVGYVYWQRYQDRQAMIARAGDPRYQAQVQRAGGIQNYLATRVPYMPLGYAIRYGLEIEREQWYALRAVMVGCLAWPWLTALSLLIFRQTMRQASINTVHVFRCAIYSADAIFPLALVLVPVVVLRADWIRYQYARFSMATVIPLMEPVSLLVIGICLLVLAWRLHLAYGKYLRFPNSFATCLASQIIVALIFLLVLFVFSQRY